MAVQPTPPGAPYSNGAEPCASPGPHLFSAEKILGASFEFDPPPLSGCCCSGDPLRWKTHSVFLYRFLPKNVQEDEVVDKENRKWRWLLTCCFPCLFPATIYSCLKGHYQGERIRVEGDALSIDPTDPQLDGPYHSTT